MNLRQVYYLLGYLSLIIGASASLCIYRIQYMFLGIGLSILGFIISGINIYLNTKYFSEEEKYPKGYLGTVLSSLPVLFMLFVIFKYKH
jgi:hypothetical protein